MKAIYYQGWLINDMFHGEQVQKLCRVECFWRLFGHWQSYGYCHQPDPAIFYVCFHPDNGLSYYHLYGIGFLEKYPEIYLGGEKESLVLFVVNGE